MVGLRLPFEMDMKNGSHLWCICWGTYITTKGKNILHYSNFKDELSKFTIME